MSLIWFSSCSQGIPESPLQSPAESTTITLPTSAVTPDLDTQPTSPQIGLTYQSPDGNKYALGKGHIQGNPINIPLSGKPVWVVAIPSGEGSIWAVSLENGDVSAFYISENTYNPIDLENNSSPAGQPPILIWDNEELTTTPALTFPSSIITHPIILPKGSSTVYISQEGNINLENGSEHSALKINALLDGRILADERGRLLLLTSPSAKYNHGVLGDEFEAEQVSLISTSPTFEVSATIPIPNGKVVEGISPIWTDLNNDGTREIIVTISNQIDGAQIIVLSESGELLAASQPIGQGYRWRHQIAAAPFGPNGEIEIVSVLTPHIGGVVEFFQLHNGKLENVAQIDGYTSHVMDSRNLDMAVAGDFDGDGIVELLLPSQDLRSLGVIQRIHKDAIVELRIPLGAKILTNFAAVTYQNGLLSVGIGLDSNVLRIWLP